MNLLGYVSPALDELNLAIKDAGFESLEEYMKNKEGKDLSSDERVAYYLGRMNLIEEILIQLKHELGDEEE
jgi:hypothetical protein